MSKKKHKRHLTKKELDIRNKNKLSEIQERNNRGFTLDKMWTLGFIVNTLQNSQLNYYLIRKGNKFLDNTCGADIIAYYENISAQITQPHFAVMQLSEMLNHNGPLVATSIQQLPLLERHQSNAPKYLYVWDLEFLRYPHVLDESMIYSWYNNDYGIITRCEDYKQVLENNFDVKVKAVIPDCDISQFISFIGREIIHGKTD